MANARSVRIMPRRIPASLKAQGMKIRPEPTIPFQHENIFVREPCFPVSLSISNGIWITNPSSSYKWVGIARKDFLFVKWPWPVFKADIYFILKFYCVKLFSIFLLKLIFSLSFTEFRISCSFTLMFWVFLLINKLEVFSDYL